MDNLETNILLLNHYAVYIFTARYGTGKVEILRLGILYFVLAPLKSVSTKDSLSAIH